MSIRKKIGICLIAAALLFAGCRAGLSERSASNEDPSYVIGQLSLSYAQEFSVDYLRYDALFVTVGTEDCYLVLPEKIAPDEKKELMSALPADAVVLQKPFRHIYNASSSSVDLFWRIGALSELCAVSTKESDWTLPYMKDALSKNRITYVGKYSAPDIEGLLEAECDLAIENTMIYHAPQTREQLSKMGIPVFIERSSYETHPLGRLEWVRLYGLLLDREAEAEAFFAEKAGLLSSLSETLAENENPKSAVFFFYSPNGYVNVRKPGDYVARMIELSGGTYALSADTLKVKEDALSTMNLQMEAFYDLAHDADILFYNSTIYGGLASVSELTEKNALFADFQAVKEHNVWCTDQNVFQETGAMADMLMEMNRILTGHTDGAELHYFYHIE